MKKKTAALATALTLVVSLVACGEKTTVSAETTDITNVEQTDNTTKETDVAEEATPKATAPVETEEDLAQKQIEKIKSALGVTPYYGDTANCKMTAEQATAYAQLIADGLAGDFSFRGGYDERFDITSWNDTFRVYTSEYRDPYEVDRFQVILGDFSCDGIPYLYVYSSNIIKNNDNQSFEIYGWKGNTTKLVADTHSGTSSIAWETYDLYEDENDHCGIKLLFNTGHSIGERSALYSFSEGDMVETHVQQAAIGEDGLWHITEDGVETGVYTGQEYYPDHVVLMDVQELKKNHAHTLPYTCFYDMTPCALEEMVNYLNAYASVMSDGQSVPVEIKKANIVKHDGTGIITKGEVPRWKVDSLEILRQYMAGELVIASGNADSAMYTDGFSNGVGFYFGLNDINDDNVQELILAYKRNENDEHGDVQIHFPPSYECLSNVYGFDNVNGTYLVSEGSVCTIERVYTYDGTSFSQLGYLEGDWESDDGGPYTLIENGVKRDIREEEFWAILNDWNNRHTKISSQRANIYLNIENIEKSLQVKINIQNSGEWLVTAIE